MSKVYIISQKPISTNAMKKGRSFLTKDYKNFRESASLELAFQRPIMRKGKNVVLSIVFHCKELYRGDLDNMAKSTIDCCVDAGIIEDDRFVETLILKKVKDNKDFVEIEVLN